MEQKVANIRVRAAGTIGGNLAFSDPHSDPATFLLASDATIVMRSRAGERTLPIGDFLVGPYETALAPGRASRRGRHPGPRRRGIRGPRQARLPRATGGHGDVPGADRAQESSPTARVAVGSVGPVPVRVGEAERLLTGLDAELPDEAVVALAAEAAAEDAGPTADANGSVDYKRALVATLVRRTFVAACAASLKSGLPRSAARGGTRGSGSSRGSGSGA